MKESQNENELKKIRDEKNIQETYARIHAPTHKIISHFRKHEKIEGFLENENVPDFLGCDRLLKIDSIFGKLQMGYNPRNNRSFIYANIKTSIYDTAASAYHTEIKESKMFRSIKEQNENVLYSSKRRTDTAVLLYKAENKPWTENSMAPYIKRANQGALRKTMPFLIKDDERNKRVQLKLQRKQFGEMEREKISEGKFDELAPIRMSQRNALYEENLMQAIVLKKEQQSRLFFRSLNMALDIQKHEMFAYYKDVKRQRAGGMTDAAEDLPPTPPDKDKDQGD